MAPRTNREILTGGKKYSQKKAKKHAVEEVVFDKDSRQEYLTGFHKRKVERQKKAKEFHEEQARLAKIEERKQLKLQRQEELLAQMKKYDQNLKELSGEVEDSEDEETNEKKGDDEKNEKDEQQDDEEQGNDTEDWDGFSDDKPRGILKRKYSAQGDETEVFIEDISNQNIEEVAKANYVNLAKSQKVLEDSIKRAKEYANIVNAPKTKKKKFRYLSKGERRANNRKRK